MSSKSEPSKGEYSKKENDNSIKDFNNLQTIFSLIHDHQIENKIDGLNKCKNLLETLAHHDCGSNNLYEVIYKNLKTALYEKDEPATKLTAECFTKFIHILPCNAEEKVIGELMALTLSETHMEANIPRKKILIQLINEIITKLGVGCVKHKKKFSQVIIENFHNCTNFAVREKLMSDLIICMELWLTQCWCVWRYETDHTWISVLLKILYSLEEKEIEFLSKIQNLLVLLISLSKETEQTNILDQITKCEVKNGFYPDRLKCVVEKIKT